MMSPEEFAACLDATNLNLDASDAVLCALCDEAAHAGYASVCVYPTSVSLCSNILYGSKVGVCTVIGFPHGRSHVESKREEILRSVENGATEVDIVLNYAALRAGGRSLASEEIASLCQVAHASGALSKVIVETCYLNHQQKLMALSICEDAGSDFIKTSTGFGSAGAQLEDVILFKERRTKNIEIKASGGIKTLKSAMEMLQAGATRLGVSAASNLMAAFDGDDVMSTTDHGSY